MLQLDSVLAVEWRFFGKIWGLGVLLNRSAVICVAFYGTNLELIDGGNGTAG